MPYWYFFSPDKEVMGKMMSIILTQDITPECWLENLYLGMVVHLHLALPLYARGHFPSDGKQLFVPNHLEI